ncbi:MAG: hypothetical protein M1829_001276 [Trizodia sp. TS-e1964]|nr:MAG: hypothetical protein M1829_001276 [Trizodia sp. TS-e1964]
MVSAVLKTTFWTLAAVVGCYCVSLAACSNTWLQRHSLYAHKIAFWWENPNSPESFGFAKGQVTPFEIPTPDGETLYAWHILPAGLYARNEAALANCSSGVAKDVTATKAFELLTVDEESRLVVFFHGNAGTVVQGWRPAAYRTISAGSPEKIHILAIDYRGFGLSSGSPSEEGVIIDGIAAVNWALKAAKIPSHRIVIMGHSLGTAVSAAVAEHFASSMPDQPFAGLVLVAGFSDLPTLLLTYNIGGIIPVLSPLQYYPYLQKLATAQIVDTWHSAERLASYVRASSQAWVYLIHSENDYDIHWKHSDALFYSSANATSVKGLSTLQVDQMKITVEHGDAGYVNEWNQDGQKVICEEILRHGGML